MKRVLVCEDEAAIRSFVVLNLKRAGFEPVEAASGEAALEQYARYEAEGGIDVALLDAMLPGIDGFSVCRELRRRNSRMGIIMLTARTQEAEKVAGLRMGADDYVTKPFAPSELIARIEVLCRRIAREQQTADRLTSGAFTLDLRLRRLTRDGEPIELTQVEFQMMEYFFSNAGTVLSRAAILRRVWGETYCGDEKIVDVNIRRLRMKVESDPSTPRHIVTVWGEGYRWDA